MSRWKRQGRVEGNLSGPEAGMAQKIAAKFGASGGLGTIVSSPHPRAMQVAQAVKAGNRGAGLFKSIKLQSPHHLIGHLKAEIHDSIRNPGKKLLVLHHAGLKHAKAWPLALAVKFRRPQGVSRKPLA